jgi:hypothetical protein
MGRRTAKKNQTSTTVADDARTSRANITPLRPTDTKPQQSTSGPKPASAGRPAMPTHDQIAKRARTIWEKNGCKPDRDEQNWLEAEAQLKAEMERS